MLSYLHIRRRVKDLTKKLEFLSDSTRKTARDKLEEAMVAFENGNFPDAYSELTKANDLAAEAFNKAQDNQGMFHN